MASLLAWLAASGVSDSDGVPVASAQCFFYAAGSGLTPIAVYGNAEKTTTLSQPVVTDAGGRATVYVDSIPKCVVLDSAGALIGTWDRIAVAASNVEVESVAFMGIKTDGSTGAGGRVALSTVADRALTSFGATDWQFASAAGSVARNVRVELNDRGLNVKGAGTVGAKGDGLTIDTAAFKTAIAQIKAAGGGRLIIPPGAYILDDILTVDFPALTIAGAGNEVTQLYMNHATNNVFSVTSAVSGLEISDLLISVPAAVATNTGTGAIYSVGVNSLFRNLKILNFDKGINLAAGSFWVEVHHCYVTATAATKHCIFVQGASTSNINILGCYLEGTGGAGIGVEVSGATNVSKIYIGNNVFGTLTKGFVLGSTVTGSDYRLIGNNMSGCTTCVEVNATTAAGFKEYANNFGSGTLTDLSAGGVWGSFAGGKVGTAITAAATIQPRGGRFFVVSGNTNIDHIETLGRQVGDILTFKFTGTPTVNDNTAAAPSNYAAVQTAGAFAATADDILSIIYDGTDWKEYGRSVL